MSHFEALLRSFFEKRLEGDKNSDKYVTIDRSGRAVFDVGSYFISAEGQRQVKEIAKATQAERESEEPTSETAEK